MPDRRIRRRLNFSPLTPAGAANILSGVAASTRLLSSAHKAYKRRRPMSSIKKKAEKAVRRGRRNNKAVAINRRVGPFLGSIAATKPVKPVKGTTLYRKVVHDQLGGTAQEYAGGHSLWLGGSSIGQHDEVFKIVADSFICHYLKRVSDHRSSRTQGPVGQENQRIFNRMEIFFGRVGGNTDTEALTVHTVTNASIDDMVTSLSASLKSRWINHSELPIRVLIYRTRGHAWDQVQLRDDFVEKAIFTFSSKANYKINNTTVGGEGSTNVNAIDANPIDGRIYTFRNRVPIFSPSYLMNLDTTVSLALQQVSAIGDGYVPSPFIDGKYGVNYQNLNKIDVPDSLHAPVLRPSVVFNNCKTSTKVQFAPGGFKTFSMSYAHSGTMNSLFKHIQKQVFHGATPNQRIVPPGADSFLICLKPTIRTGGANDMALHTQAEYLYKCNMKSGKPCKLPTVQDLQADPVPPPEDP